MNPFRVKFIKDWQHNHVGDIVEYGNKEEYLYIVSIGVAIHCPNDFGHKLQMFRHSLNITQADFGKRCGISQQHINKLENGRNEPNYKTIRKIKQAFPVFEV